MIISHEHRFIFLRTAKTASTSIETALSRICGGRDILTPDAPEDDRRKLDAGGRLPQNYMIPISRWDVRDYARALERSIRMKPYRPRYYHHMSAAEVRRRVSRRVWDSYFKFCFVRNPWDRFVSLFYWKSRAGSAVPASDTASLAVFARSPAARVMVEKGWDIFAIDDRVVVDRVCRYEEMEDELEFVRARLGIGERIELPRAKGQHRAAGTAYRDVLDDHLREFVTELCRKEIEYTGYVY